MGLQLAMARLGTAAALSVSAPVARRFSLSMPLLVSLSLLIIGLLSFLVFCVMDRRLDKSEGPTAKTADDEEQFRWSDIGTTLRSPGFWLITLFCVLFYSAVSPFLKFATKLMVIKYGIDTSVAGFFTSIAPFGTILLTPLFGSLYDRYGKGVTLIITGTLMLTCVHAGFSLPIHSSTFAVSLMVLLSIGYSLAPAALWPCVPKIIPLKCLGTAYSMIFFIQNFGRSIIPMIVGKANESDPTYTTSMLIFAGTALAAAVVAFGMLYVDRREGYGLQKPNIRRG
jgi:nitrate/nitrite transporter NarK